MFPLFTTGTIDANSNLLYALAIGALFGIVLERTGFGSAKHIAPIFFFKNLKVSQTIVSAILTCSTLIVIASYNGWLDYTQVFIPDTYVWPYLVGGIMFGGSMVMSGWCPGTAVVGFASGKIDAVVFLLGLMCGMYFYFDIYEYIEGFANSGYLGRYTIDMLFGGDMYTSSYLVTVITGVALAVFMHTMKKIRDKKENSK
jgi:uncharacterized membrane protein YedE/YeeE